ncbi:MAG: glycosyltransferase family 2 protein [Verrucomicrobiota bacterium]
MAQAESQQILIENQPDGSPTFSILVEAENLSTTEISKLHDSLDTLAAQGDSLKTADAVLLIDSGQLTDETRKELNRRYPWLTIRRVDAAVSYGGMKGRSAGLVTSDVIVLSDSDCRYQPDWLRQILAPFQNHPDVHIVGGETTTPIHGPYSLAIALTFVFPRFSGGQTIAPSRTYWANNVAVRRVLLESMPVPDPRQLYRGQNIVHSQAASAAGYTIWRQPRARALHALPLPAEYSRRYYRMGRDSVHIARLARDESGQSYRGDMEPDCQTGGRFHKLAGRLRLIRAENPRALWSLPLALPVLFLGALCYYAGRLTASLTASPAPTN